MRSDEDIVASNDLQSDPELFEFAKTRLNSNFWRIGENDESEKRHSCFGFALDCGEIAFAAGDAEHTTTLRTKFAPLLIDPLAPLLDRLPRTVVQLDIGTDLQDLSQRAFRHDDMLIVFFEKNAEAFAHKIVRDLIQFSPTGTIRRRARAQALRRSG